MITEIQKLEGVKHLLSTAAYENAVSELFTDNQTQIVSIQKEVIQAKGLVELTENRLKGTILDFIGGCEFELRELKKERKDAKQYIASNEQEWTEECPISLGDILAQVFQAHS